MRVHTEGEHVTLYTSRYQNGAEITRLGLVPIGITAGAPKFTLKCELVGNLMVLAPDRATFKHSELAFRVAYEKKLAATGVAQIDALIQKMSGRRDAVLLCFECIPMEGEDSCHRRMFAAWWKEQTGELITELPDLAPFKGKPIVVAKNDSEQIRLL